MKQKTYDHSGTIEERAVLVGLALKSDRTDSERTLHSLNELVRLAETAGVTVLTTVVQRKDAADPKWLIGKGKVDELKAVISELGANTAIFDRELSGAQVRNLEQALDVKIIDRTQLILDIFAQRARTREGILQVELAQLNYLLPRLSGHGKNLSRLGGGIGTRGPGETKLETDRRHIGRRIAELKAALKDVVRHRTLLRERRKKAGVYQIALVGYTNAGKSTLLNRLTQSDVYAENRLFATLDPTSRVMALPNGQRVVVTDTVGFIRNLPHDLVAAFRATLEEACEADLLLHVVDSSSEMREQQMRVVDEVLRDLGASGKERITVFNKIDAIPPEKAELLIADGSYVRISAWSDSDLERLKAAIQEKLTGGEKTVRIPAARGDLAALAYRVGDVLRQDVDGEHIVLNIRIKTREYEKAGYLLEPYVVAEANETEAER